MLAFASLHLIPFCELNFNNHNFRICYFCAVLSHFSHVELFATPWTVACKAPLFMKFSRQEYWNGLPFPPPGDLPDPGIEPASLMSFALADGFFTTSTTWEAPFLDYNFYTNHSFLKAVICSQTCLTITKGILFNFILLSDISLPLSLVF